MAINTLIITINLRNFYLYDKSRKYLNKFKNINCYFNYILADYFILLWYF